MDEWIRIPAPIDSEADRRAIAGALLAAGLMVRIVKSRPTPKGVWKKYIEYKEQNA